MTLGGGVFCRCQPWGTSGIDTCRERNAGGGDGYLPVAVLAMAPGQRAVEFFPLKPTLLVTFSISAKTRRNQGAARNVSAGRGFRKDRVFGAAPGGFSAPPRRWCRMASCQRSSEPCPKAA